MKKFILLMAAIFTLNLSLASELTVLRIGAPGGNSEIYTAAMSSRLNEKGWNTSIVGFADCKGAEQWVKNNPTKPVMFIHWSDDFILPIVDPNHPRSCAGLTVSETTLVTPITQSYHMICSKHETSAEKFLTKSNVKVGIWNHPIQTQVLKDLLSDLKLDHKVVGFARGADLMQAAVSGDVDYIVLSSENLVRNIQGQCFITTAPLNKAKLMSDFRTNKTQVSIESLSKKLTRVGTGLSPVYVAYNVDMTQLRNNVVEILSNSPEYVNLWTSTTVKTGVMAGESPATQWKNFSKFIYSFKP